MREAINEFDLDAVVGGTVSLSEKRMKIAFSTLNEKYDIKCSFKEARNLCNQLFAANADMTESQYDALVKKEFQSRGWI